VCQNPIPLVDIKIAGKWMFIPLKMVLIGIDPYPFILTMIAKGLHITLDIHILQRPAEIDPVCTYFESHPIIFDYLCAFAGQRKKGRQSTAKLLLAKSHWQRSIYVLQQWKDFQACLSGTVHATCREI
jgi:hypothetical protein